jgi:hypothetical protein
MSSSSQPSRIVLPKAAEVETAALVPTAMATAKSIEPWPGLEVLSQISKGGCRMPWKSNDAERHTHKATTPTLQELWAKVANERLESTGDEARAIREANAVVARQAERG